MGDTNTDFFPPLNSHDKQTIEPNVRALSSSPKARLNVPEPEHAPATTVREFCIKHIISDDITTIAETVYNQTTNAEKRLPRDPMTLVASAVFVACRLAAAPRTYKDIYVMAGISRSKLVSGVKIIETHAGRGNAMRVTHNDLLIRYFSPLGLHPTVQAVCLDLGNRITYHHLSDGKNPTSIAAAAVFFICRLFGIPMAVYELSVVAEISEWTIKRNFVELRSAYAKLVDPKWLENGVGDLDRLLPPVKVSGPKGVAV